jgi:hypothetical protein
VQFQVSDIYFPGPERVLEELHGHDVLQGEVVGESVGGESGETFVMVAVDGLSRPVVVPFRCTREAAGLL